MSLTLIDIRDGGEASASASASISTSLDEVLHTYAQDLSAERDSTVRARSAAGLDAVWQNAREQYQGIDEVNRGRADARFAKGETLDGPITTPLAGAAREDRSTVFVNITRPYTNAGTSRVADILLPAGDRLNWDLKPTPVSETAIVAQTLEEFPELAQALPPELLQKVMQSDEERSAALEIAKTIIEDNLVECKYSSETRKQIGEAGKVGTGVLKGPFPRMRKLSSDVQAMLDSIPHIYPEDELQGASVRMQVELRLMYQPAGECIAVENCYPDMPGCGTDIQNGRFFWERVPDLTKRRLQELAEDDSYFASQILACMNEDPIPLIGEFKGSRKKSYDLWIRTGPVRVDKLRDEPAEPTAATNEDRASEGGGEATTVFGQIVLCNNRIIKVGELPLDHTGFPYYMLKWEARPDSWAGIGIPEQLETPQRGLNASVRAGNDNMAWSVGPQVLHRDGLIEPADGEDWTPHPYKRWKVLTEQLQALTGKEMDPKIAMQFLEFPNYLDKILPWIEFWLRMAENTTGLPLLLQGHASTDSVGVTQAMQNASTTNLRLFVKHWDDDVCTPFIQRMYEWVQRYGPEVARGDAVAHALGSSILITRETQQQAIVQFLDRAVQPIYGISPAKLSRAFFEGMQINPDTLMMDEEEKAQLEAAQQQPDPKVEAAQIQAQTQLQVAELRKQVDVMEAMLNAQLKGLSLDHAQQVVETQMQTTLAAEGIKQQGAQEKEVVKAAVAPQVASAPGKQAAPATTQLGAAASSGSEAESIDNALDALGI